VPGWDKDEGIMLQVRAESAYDICRARHSVRGKIGLWSKRCSWHGKRIREDAYSGAGVDIWGVVCMWKRSGRRDCWGGRRARAMSRLRVKGRRDWLSGAAAPHKSQRSLIKTCGQVVPRRVSCAGGLAARGLTHDWQLAILVGWDCLPGRWPEHGG
jgi:hypothetical protein